MHFSMYPHAITIERRLRLVIRGLDHCKKFAGKMQIIEGYSPPDTIVVEFENQEDLRRLERHLDRDLESVAYLDLFG